ncbi:MAG: rhomboid family intramembrane serine protease [Cyanobacteria bacterium M5B4]|nr:MAG: rhomboid family intramembrane serine protease [Cyanobacteria bacterium M5B4]
MLPLYDDNPTKTVPIVVYSLIILNVAVFLFQINLNGNEGRLIEMFFDTWSVIPRQLFRSPSQEYFTLVTYQFLHGGLGHILGNMWYLWIFGNNIEDHLGKFKFVLFYLTCGILAAVVQSLFVFNTNVPLIGASGSVSGVMGAYITRYPSTKILTFIPPIFVLWLPAVFILGFWIFGQTIYAFSALNSNVAFIAHVAGFVAGMVLVRVFNEEV